MSYLWIVLVVFIALSPLISAMPSRRQRKIADLRQAAAVSGLFVQLKQPPGEHGLGATRAWYGRRRERHHAPAVPVTLLCEGGAWSLQQGSWPDQRLARLQDLPSGITGLSEDRLAIGVFWDEQGEPEDVQGINQVLSGLLNAE